MHEEGSGAFLLRESMLIMSACAYRESDLGCVPDESVADGPEMARLADGPEMARLARLPPLS